MFAASPDTTAAAASVAASKRVQQQLQQQPYVSVHSVAGRQYGPLPR